MSSLRRAALAALAAVVLTSCSGGGGAPAEPEIEGVVVEAGASRGHVNGAIDYPERPPSGGDHAAVFVNCGFYNQVVPDELAVHSLEHGAVWIAYQPEVPVAELERLRSIMAGHDHVLASAYPDPPLSSRYVLLAWERRLELDSLDDERFEAFIEGYENGASAPEQGGACAGGLGEPL